MSVLMPVPDLPLPIRENCCPNREMGRASGSPDLTIRSPTPTWSAHVRRGCRWTKQRRIVTETYLDILDE
jgi:hypothetical protein